MFPHHGIAPRRPCYPRRAHAPPRRSRARGRRRPVDRRGDRTPTRRAPARLPGACPRDRGASRPRIARQPRPRRCGGVTYSCTSHLPRASARERTRSACRLRDRVGPAAIEHSAACAGSPATSIQPEVPRSLLLELLAARYVTPNFVGARSRFLRLSARFAPTPPVPTRPVISSASDSLPAHAAERPGGDKGCSLKGLVKRKLRPSSPDLIVSLASSPDLARDRRDPSAPDRSATAALSRGNLIPRFLRACTRIAWSPS